ncbi:MAG: hypothetical protein WBG69_08200 [Arcobacteraceae bacterium]
MKRSIVLLELIVSLLLFSLIAIGSSKMIFTLVHKNKENTFIVENNLILETTRLFITKQKYFSNIVLRGTELYFQNNLLLENISKYEIIQNSNFYIIDICIHKDTICQTWKMRL